MFSSKKQCFRITEVYTGKESHNQVVWRYIVKHACLTIVAFLNFREQVHYMVCLTKLVLNVVIFSLITELAKLVLKRSRLLKEAMNLSFYFHLIKN